MKPETKSMLERLTKSKNQLVAERAREILAGFVSIDTARKFAGGFLRAVLDGDEESALARADSHNLNALLQADFESELPEDLRPQDSM